MRNESDDINNSIKIKYKKNIQNMKPNELLQAFFFVRLQCQLPGFEHRPIVCVHLLIIDETKDCVRSEESHNNFGKLICTQIL